MTEPKAEINAGLIIVTGHMPVQSDDVEMTQEHATPDRVQHADTTAAADQTANPDAGDTRAHKSRRIASPANSKTPAEWPLSCAKVEPTS